MVCMQYCIMVSELFLNSLNKQISEESQRSRTCQYFARQTNYFDTISSPHKIVHIFPTMLHFVSLTKFLSHAGGKVSLPH